MPKISYLDRLDNGADYTEVTASHIEQKIADIEALLRGMIDEDNLLAKDDGSNIVPLSPSNVVDMPVETRPVQHCMKFFGKTTDHPDGIVEKLFDEFLQRAEVSSSFSVLNGIGDKEIVINPEGTREIQQKTISIEIPDFWTPITWGQLWDYVAESNAKIGMAVNYDGGSFEDKYVLFELFSKGGFLQEFNVRESDYVYETSFNLDESHFFEHSNEVSLLRNLFTTTVRVYPKDSKSGEWLYRVVPSLLCRVNP